MGVQTYREGRSQQGHCPSKRPWASEKKKKKLESSSLTLGLWFQLRVMESVNNIQQQT